MFQPKYTRHFVPRDRKIRHFQRSTLEAAASADARGLAQEMQKLRTEHQEAEKRNDTLEKQMQEDLVET